MEEMKRSALKKKNAVVPNDRISFGGFSPRFNLLPIEGWIKKLSDSLAVLSDNAMSLRASVVNHAQLPFVKTEIARVLEMMTVIENFTIG